VRRLAKLLAGDLVDLRADGLDGPERCESCGEALGEGDRLDT
jgi:hypothetical protein